MTTAKTKKTTKKKATTRKTTNKKSTKKRSARSPKPKLKASVDSLLVDLQHQVKKIQKDFVSIRNEVKKIDKKAANKLVTRAKTYGNSEWNRLTDGLQKSVDRLAKDVEQTKGTFLKDSQKVVKQAKNSVGQFKKQVEKAIKKGRG